MAGLPTLKRRKDYIDMRVQIPAYSDRWMMGDRYGTIVKVINKPQLMSPGIKIRRDVAYVKLDKSGKTCQFLFDDCTEV